MTPAGFPHSDICASKPACGSTQLIAACHVLHRLPVPRHPPYALSILMVHWIALCSFQRPDATLSRAQVCLSSRAQGPENWIAVTRFGWNPPPLDWSNYPRARTHGGELRLEPPTQSVCGFRSVACCHANLLPRKEVIQPHLQVRLPCYDFTPIASPTFADRVPQGVSCACFGYCLLSWCDGRCVQGPGTYSPRHADPRLLATPPSRSRVADCDPNLD